MNTFLSIWVGPSAGVAIVAVTWLNSFHGTGPAWTTLATRGGLAAVDAFRCWVLGVIVGEWIYEDLPIWYP